MSSAHLKAMLFCLFVPDLKNIFLIEVLSLIYTVKISSQYSDEQKFKVLMKYNFSFSPFMFSVLCL